ncbi:MAG: hypothetical protein KDB99_06305 [Chitinophagaceae bacterium]|nr:hypothetical protein [Chitinophagaceae bacterium]
MNRLKKSIQSTIGVVYEIIVWDNIHEKKGLCEVYNRLAQNAKFDIICFLHEDIIFETKDWGKSLCDKYMDNADLGVIGVAGSKYKSRVYSGWYTGLKEFDCANIKHQYPDRFEHIYLSPSSKGILIEDVVCVDGVFISCRKSVWEEIRFNENEIPGFHFYDIDFSVRASKAWKVSVTYDINIVHFTLGGDFGENWVNTAFLYHNMVNKELPFTKLDNLAVSPELRIAKTWLDVLKNYKISLRSKYRWIKDQRLLNKPVLWYGILKFLFYYPLNLRFIHKSFRKQ